LADIRADNSPADAPPMVERDPAEKKYIQLPLLKDKSSSSNNGFSY
jgi:hypothetical protein